MKAKKVSLMELFYDLVFVYAIANMTHLIHHLDKKLSFIAASLRRFGELLCGILPHHAPPQVQRGAL